MFLFVCAIAFTQPIAKSTDSANLDEHIVHRLREIVLLPENEVETVRKPRNSVVTEILQCVQFFFLLNVYYVCNTIV